ncbi:hypothetical protein VNO77_19024 [Canavalia gladiata]|uniref:Uncharacterized protein n=1 Tax=Canavalia gladiata TaxID=3824 RepID=A0AAN9LM00_CANGL
MLRTEHKDRTEEVSSKTEQGLGTQKKEKKQKVSNRTETEEVHKPFLRLLQELKEVEDVQAINRTEYMQRKWILPSLTVKQQAWLETTPANTGCWCYKAIACKILCNCDWQLPKTQFESCTGPGKLKLLVVPEDVNNSNYIPHQLTER